ncbi:HAD-IA family hydrolase [Pseudohongiella spirulinae]|uniref:Phosphoglycolate phosphatase n=1 Tax=Pseudohongiella spirulinae TaxID=1249552 RepID=A0A0S2KDU6_9GAMM|nr:HAD-IA family hydrolase [Pseudohongiella spirulinae]ALO46291.1 Phosphoglycolate phosphatase [Pseudohongiella spirulinae]
MMLKRPLPASVLFDLDGTLIDTAPDFVSVINQLCAQFDINPPSPKAIHATVSSGARALTQLAFGLSPQDDGFEIRLQALLDLYGQQINASHARLYPRMQALLLRLSDHAIPWGVVTNKPLRYSEPLLSVLGLSENCAVLICPDHVSHSKPHPEPLLLACKRLGCEPEASIYVGDHPRDIEAGRAAGMATIAAAYGYLPPESPIDDWQADFIAASTDDISRYIWQEDTK